MYQGNHNKVGSYSVNNLNQYTNIAGITVNHDNNGNFTSGDNTYFYTYDVENRLKSLYGYDSAYFKYDPLGRLYQIKVNGVTKQFLYDDSRIIAEYDVDNNIVTRIVPGSGTDESWVMYEGASTSLADTIFLHQNYNMSVIAASDSQSNVLFTNSYDVYGISSETNQGRLGYTGQLYLYEFGLYYYKARIYHPKLGRFLQTDPVGYEDQMNLYAYVGNDPINMFDPAGMEMECVTDNDGNETCTYTPDDFNDYSWGDAVIDGGLIFIDILNTPISPTPDASILVGVRATARAVAKNQAAKKASEKFAKDLAKKIERDLGKKARRNFHDVKTPGAGDRTKEELIEDAVNMYQDANKPIPSWLKSLGG